jgi:hypothetical protein
MAFLQDIESQNKLNKTQFEEIHNIVKLQQIIIS